MGAAEPSTAVDWNGRRQGVSRVSRQQGSAYVGRSLVSRSRADLVYRGEADTADDAAVDGRDFNGQDGGGVLDMAELVMEYPVLTPPLTGVGSPF
jgi:hypothetical protein